MKIKKIYICTPKILREKARDKIKFDHEQVSKEVPEAMINPYYFTDRELEVGFNIALDNHHINHSNSKPTIKPNYSDFGTDKTYVNKIFKEIANKYARIINLYDFVDQTVFSARFEKQWRRTDVSWNWNIYKNKKQSKLKRNRYHYYWF